jgi:hypothetical protein
LFVVLFGWLSNITSGFFVGTFEVGDGLLSLVKSMHAKLTRQHQSEFLKGFILLIKRNPQSHPQGQTNFVAASTSRTVIVFFLTFEHSDPASVVSCWKMSLQKLFITWMEERGIVIV